MAQTGVVLLFIVLLASCLSQTVQLRESRSQRSSLAPVSVSVNITAEKINKINDFLTKYMADHNVVGLALALVNKGEIVYSNGYGYQDKEQRIPVTPEKTLFRWASMSKMLTSIVSVKLRTAGLLDLDADVTKYLHDYQVPDTFVIPCASSAEYKWFNETRYPCRASTVVPSKYFAYIPIPTEYQHITPRMLLAHFGGIMFYSDGEGDAQPPSSIINNPEYNKGIEWGLQFFDKKPLIAVPGFNYSYTSFGFNLQGIVAEKAAGQAYEELVRYMIKDVAKMDTFLPDREWDGPKYPNRAVGYWQGNKQGSNDVSYKMPGGGFMSTIFDVAKLCAHYRDESILTNEEKNVAWNYYSPKNKGYGLGFDVQYNSQGQVVRVGHTGNQEKTSTRLSYYIDADYGIAMMSNSQDFNVGEATEGVDKIIRQ